MKLLNFYKIYFDFAYFCCVCPFRFVQVKNVRGELGEYRIKTWLPQTFMCMLSHSMAVIWLVGITRQWFPTQTKYPSVYFVFMDYLFIIVNRYLLFRKFYLYQQAFLDIVLFLDSKEFHQGSWLNPAKITTRTSWVQKLVWGKWTPLIVCICHLFNGYGILFQDSQFYASSGALQTASEPIKNLPTFWMDMQNSACFAFFLGNTTSCHSSWKMYAVKILAVPTTFGYLQEYLLESFDDIPPLIAAITLWSAVKSFALNISGRRSLEVIEVIHPTAGKANWAYKRRTLRDVCEQFKMLQKLTAIITRSSGDLITGFVLEYIPYYATNIGQVFIGNWKDPDYVKMIRVFFFFCSGNSFLIFSANVCHQVLKK